MSAPLETLPDAQVAAEPSAVTIADHRPGPLTLLRETWRHRALVPRIGIRVIIKGVSGTILGRGWLVIRPVMSIFAMALLFGAVLDAPSQGIPYILFLLGGLLGWLTFERCLLWATRSFDVYRRLAKSFDFPLLLVPTSSVIPAFIELGIISTLMTLTVLFFLVTDGTFYIQVSPELLLVPAGLALSLALAWGIGLWTSALNAKARDVRLTLRYVFMVWLYVTPVLYPTSALPESWRFLGTINPVAAPVELVKRGLLGIGEVHTSALVVSLSVTVGAIVSGLFFFAWISPGLLRDTYEGLDEEELV